MSNRPVIRFEHLNTAEKVVYAAGAVASTLTRLLEKALERTADVIVEAERAFEEGRDPQIEEARFRDL